MIIYEKIQRVYPEYKYDSTKKNKLGTLAKKYNLDKIGYTYEDFKEDYKKEYEHYKELKTVFNILKTGKSPSMYLTQNFRNYLVKGFNYNFPLVSKEHLKQALEVIEIECDYKSYNLRLESYQNHIELFGEQKDLEAFRQDFKLDFEIILDKTKEKWHIAFDGILSEFLKNR